ncbi:MAG: alpha/beta fold hydrolase [Gammaproteobacteria bacterium]|nr:alpha/beta fold hydrolase [Gammaproteobacteria bacterium]
MREKWLGGLLALCLLLPGVAAAEVLVLIQGYLGEDDPWRRSGISTVIQRAGWQDGGHLLEGSDGVRRNGPERRAAKSFYTLALPTEAPLLLQVRHLERYMAYLLARHEGESVYLIGHSAGGVLARLYMVQHPTVRISALITIATPHLGTGTAEAGLMASQSPFGWVAPLMGAGSINRSRGLYHDLSREQPGTLLFWLNRQPHPASRYVAVIHTGGGLFGLGDLVVPEWSQDMNNVDALRGAVVSVPVSGEHTLNATDGSLVLDLLRRLQAS